MHVDVQDRPHLSGTSAPLTLQSRLLNPRSHPRPRVSPSHRLVRTAAGRIVCRQSEERLPGPVSCLRTPPLNSFAATGGWLQLLCVRRAPRWGLLGPWEIWQLQVGARMRETLYQSWHFIACFCVCPVCFVIRLFKKKKILRDPKRSLKNVNNNNNMRECDIDFEIKKSQMNGFWVINMR